MLTRDSIPATLFRVLLPILCLLLWAGAAAAAPAVPAATGNATQKDTDLTRIWISRTVDLAALLDEAQTLQANAENLAKPLSDSLRNTRAQFTRLSGLFQASRGHPTEQLAILQQMRGLLSQLNKNISPLETIAATVAQRLEETAGLQKDLREFSSESASDGLGKDADDEALINYTTALNDAGKRLNAASVRLGNILAPAKSLRDRMLKGVSAMESGLTEIWESYYLTPSASRLEDLSSIPSLLADWAKSLGSRMAFAYPQSLSAWRSAFGTIFLAAFIVWLLAFSGIRGARSLPGHWRSACVNAIRKAVVPIGSGIGVLAASSNQYGGRYVAFLLLGILIIIAGIASLSWRLRVAALPSLENEPSPLSRLYVPAAIGVFMLFSDLPTRILGIMWGLTMAVFLALLFLLKRKDTPGNTLPLLERLTYSSAFWFALGSLMVTVAGYARLAILLFMLLFALASAITLGNALMALLDILVDRIVSKTGQPVRNALIQAVAVPVIWLFSLICALPWIWAVPGARSLLQNVMSTRYTVGDASFDFAKVFLILILFVLFRSLISLGRTSLEHLPDRMPNIERGVIPPLGTIFTYGFWALFGIITLGMLGVNFTSLAVVAGGLSVGIGFGMQNLFNNLVSGLMLIFGRTLLVGDYVEVAGISGTVKAISIRSTTIETPERALAYVPNSAIMAGQFINWTRDSRLVRRSIVMTVAYGSDTELVSKIMLDAGKKQVHVLKSPPPALFFSNFGDNALEFTLNVFIDDLDNAMSVLSAIRYELERRFAEHNIRVTIPRLALQMPEEEARGQDKTEGPQDTPEGRQHKAQGREDKPEGRQDKPESREHTP